MKSVRKWKEILLVSVYGTVKHSLEKTDFLRSITRGRGGNRSQNLH